MSHSEKHASKKNVRIQLPTHLGTQDQYFRLIDRRLPQTAEHLAQKPSDASDASRMTSKDYFDKLRRILPDELQILNHAMAHHTRLFAASANAEAGFDLGIEPHTVEIGGKRNWVFLFATMSLRSATNLLRMPGVRERLVSICVRRGRPKEEFVGRTIDDADEMMFMDLLCAGVPVTCLDDELAPSPQMIVDRFFDSIDTTKYLEWMHAQDLHSIASKAWEDELRSWAKN